MYDIKTAEMIERIYSSDEIDYCESFKDIEIAFCADEYYINPKSTTKAKDNYLLFSEYYEELYPEMDKAPVLYDDCLRAKLYLRVIKERFDYPYFKERLEFHRKHGDPECLREWLCKLSISQLKSFLSNVVKEQLVFTESNNSFDSLCTKLNEACVKYGAEAASIAGAACSECGYYQIENLETIFNCLDKDTIVDIFCECLEGEYKLRAAFIAHEMYIFEFYIDGLLEAAMS
jgi:hypothetical protein